MLCGERIFYHVIQLIGRDKYPWLRLFDYNIIKYIMLRINELHYNPLYSCYAIKQIFLYINSMQQEVEKVKILTLKDNRNKEEKYMLTCLLGKGKYGKVYKAIHVENPKKIFAVKVISLQSERVRNQCLQQLQIVRHLPKSLNLVQIHSQHLESNNNFYLFEQFCDGGSLLDQKKSRNGKPYTENQVFNLFFQVVTGFIELRKNNIFHEDIKPENILIKNNLYKLADFGISQLAGKIQVSAVRKGTLIYMPPQKLKGEVFTPTSKSEIFSLGVTLYEIIFGHHPYLRKRPKDYREYLKLIQQTEMKQLNLLKSIFPSPSLLIDRLIRTILRMIDISQTKRLSLEELTDYLKNTEPFTSMVVSEVEPVAQRTKNRETRYEQVGHSLIYVKSYNGIGSALVQSTKQNKNEKLKQIVCLCKQTLKLFRQISAYLQQGIFYCKNSNIYEFKKIQNQSKVGLNKIAHSTELEFIILLFILRMFTQLERVTSKVILAFDLQFGQGDTLLNGIGQDKEFINNQFLNLYMEVQVQDKKGIWLNLKESREMAKLVANLLQQISSNITCIRINFKQDMLAFIFSMHCPKIIDFAELVLNNVSNFETNEQALINLQDLMTEKSKQLKQANSILNEYSRLQALKKDNLYTEFEVAVKGRQLLLDDEINSDEFEVLSLDDL